MRAAPSGPSVAARTRARNRPIAAPGAAAMRRAWAGVMEGWESKVSRRS